MKNVFVETANVKRFVSGITIGTDGEDFIVEPFEVELSAGKAVA